MTLFSRSVRNIVLLVFALCLVCLALFVSPRLGVHAAGKTAPTLKVQPMNIGIPGDGINCSNYMPTGTICHVTVSETKNSSKGLSWYATPASGSDATFQPASGHLKPGQSVQVTITTPDCGGYFFFQFFYGANRFTTVTYSCG